MQYMKNKHTASSLKKPQSPKKPNKTTKKNSQPRPTCYGLGMAHPS